MIYFIITMILAFYWLMLETKWLTVRLPFGKPFTGDVLIQELLPLVCAVGVAMAAIASKHMVDKLANLANDEA